MTVPGKGGRPRKIPTPEIMAGKWAEYKKICDGTMQTEHILDKQGLRFVDAKITNPRPYTVLDFCLYIDLDRETFYQRYGHNPLYANIFKRILQECESRMLQLCVNGTINPKLAPLLLGRYGYTSKQEVKSDSHVEGEITYSWGADKGKDKEE